MPATPTESADPFADPLATARAAPWVASTYFAEGLPYSLVHQVSMELFTALGASPVLVGLTSLYGLPWNLKFFWAPLVDRFGTLRRWVVALELALALAVAAIAIPGARPGLGLAARGFLVVAILAATHDIAVDGFYLRALGKRDQAALSGLRAGAFRVAMIVGKSALVVLAGWTTWRLGLLVGAGMLAVLAALHAVVLPAERRAANEAARPASFARFYAEAFRSFLAQPGALTALGFILVYRAGDAMMFAMSSKLLEHLGLGLVARGALNGVAGAAGIGASIAAGPVIARLGLRRTLAPIALIQGLAILLYVAVATLRPPPAWISAAVVAEQIAAGLGTAGYMVFLLRRCAGEYRASHFAIASALMSLATTGLGSASGFLVVRLGYPAFFGLAYLAAIPGMLLARVVPTE